MPKNVLFSLKNCKNRQKLGALPSYPLSSGGWGLRFHTPTLVILHIVNCSLCICLQSTDSFGINQKTLFSCNYSGSTTGFQCRKNYAAFRMPQTMTIGFNFFVLSPPPTNFALAPPLAAQTAVSLAWTC